MRVEQEAVRQLVKSPPELWAQYSDAEALARHFNRFGEIRITALEPESTVAWEGESVSGTVTLEAVGWGTRVRLTALGTAPGSGAGAHPGPAEVVCEPAPTAVAAPRRITGLLSTFLSRRGAAAAETPEPVLGAVPGTPAAVVPTPGAPADLVAELESALDSLGQAHHRPYSRA